MTDELALLEAQGAAERAAAKAERNTPERKAKRNNGRAQRNRGYRAEHRLAKRLAYLGFERVPLSGAAGGTWSGDLRRVRGDKRHVTYLEVKHREDAMVTLDKWLEQADATNGVIIDRGAAKEPIFVAYLKDAEALMVEAGYDKEGAE